MILGRYAEFGKLLCGSARGIDAIDDAAARVGAWRLTSADLANTPVAYGELPPVEIIDMRLELRAGNRAFWPCALQSELRTTLDAGQQAILFLNRRASSTFVMCRDCGHVQECFAL